MPKYIWKISNEKMHKWMTEYVFKKSYYKDILLSENEENNYDLSSAEDFWFFYDDHDNCDILLTHLITHEYDCESFTDINEYHVQLPYKHEPTFLRDYHQTVDDITEKLIKMYEENNCDVQKLRDDLKKERDLLLELLYILWDL